MPARPRIVLLTGLAGAGKTTAVRAFEDLGFFCVDNLPVELIDTFLALLERGEGDGGGAPWERDARNVSPVALVMDARERGFARRWPRVLEAATSAGYQIEVLFLEAAEAALIRRFSETRRRHPLAHEGARGRLLTVGQAIRVERNLLASLRRRADRVIDTTELNVHQLKAILTRDFGTSAGPAALSVNLVSFGYRYGPPREADLLIDVRFLPNPHFLPRMRARTGLDRDVARKVLAGSDGRGFLKRFRSLLDFLLPRYRAEGKAYLTIGVGCTGGKHRSVAVAERLGRDLGRRKSMSVSVVHRDLERA